MPLNFAVQFDDNSDEFAKAIDDMMPPLLSALGKTAEAFAVRYITDFGYVDTGRARASITHTWSGQNAYVFNYTDDAGKPYTQEINGVPVEENRVYIGSNVPYFPYLEEGTVKMRAGHMLRRAVTEKECLDQYKHIIETFMKK